MKVYRGDGQVIVFLDAVGGGLVVALLVLLVLSAALWGHAVGARRRDG